MFNNAWQKLFFAWGYFEVRFLKTSLREGLWLNPLGSIWFIIEDVLALWLLSLNENLDAMQLLVEVSVQCYFFMVTSLWGSWYLTDSCCE